MARNDNPTLEASVDGDDALLAKFNFSELPVQFAMREPNGAVIQEREPCYQCRADGFYGRGRLGTLYQEGDIIVMIDTPNQHLEPLNRAAALKWAKWATTLPNNRAAIDIGDMAEAAQMLAKNPDVLKLDPVNWQKAVVQLSEELKIRRSGGTASHLPQLAHNFAPQSGNSGAVPILGAKISDMAQRGPGGEFRTVSASEQAASGARRATAAPPTANPLGGAQPQNR